MLMPELPRDRSVPDLATMQRAFLDLGVEIEAEISSPVVDFGFLRAMKKRRDELLEDMVRVHAATEGAIL